MGRGGRGGGGGGEAKRETKETHKDIGRDKKAPTENLNVVTGIVPMCDKAVRMKQPTLQENSSNDNGVAAARAA